ASREEQLEKNLGGSSSEKETGQNSSSESSGESPSSEGAQQKDGKASASKSKAEGSSPSEQAGGKGNGKELACEQRSLAGKTDLLADQIDALEHDAATERGGMKGKLAAIQNENSPREIAGVMRQAAGDLESQRRHQGGRGVAQARERLNELSR